MQIFLNSHGASLDVDGKWGKKTRQAAMNYWGQSIDTATEAWAAYSIYAGSAIGGVGAIIGGA